MILTKEIKLFTSKIKKKQYYLNLGYDLSNDIIIVPIYDLIKGSSEIVSVECDFCKKILNVKYNKYIASISSGGRYSCSVICAREKSKISNLEKYGVENVSQNSDIKKKKQETSLKNYGVDSPLKSSKVKDILKANNLEKYGVENVSQINDIKIKKKQTTLKNYGVENPFQSDEIKEKIKTSNNEKYGVDNPMMSDDIKNKVKETNIERYGFDSPMMSDDIKNKVKETNVERYGVDVYFKSDSFKEKFKITSLSNYGFTHPMKSNELKKSLREKNIERYGAGHITKNEDFRLKYQISNDIGYVKYLDSGISLFSCDLGHFFEMHIDNYIKRSKSNIPLCTICNPINSQKSFKEKEILDFISANYFGEIISGYRDGLEIDIYLPELKIGFEFNGLYWHSDKFVDKNYHLDKTNFFKEKNIRIIHIWEDDWIFRREILESQISNMLKINSNSIFARKCKVMEIKDSKVVSKFLNNNHIQGAVKSSLKIGLYHGDELVSIMTFDHFEGRNKMNLNDWNLNRFCNKINTNVIGGASKLLKYFIRNYSARRVISYADKDWSVGDLYYKLGFNKISESLPDYKYLVNHMRVHKSNYKKSKLNTDLTESNQMKINGVNKIYDCGKIKFELIK